MKKTKKHFGLDSLAWYDIHDEKTKTETSNMYIFLPNGMNMLA